MGNGKQGLRGTLVTGLVLAGTVVSAGCDPARAVVEGSFGTASFQVAVADDPQERAQGLMNVPEMPTLSGMIFFYDQPQRATFWMHNTMIPLDMLFIGADGVISSIHQEAVPYDKTVIDGGADILSVLEINGGMAARLGIAVGDRVKHPGFPTEVSGCP